MASVHPVLLLWEPVDIIFKFDTNSCELYVLCWASLLELQPIPKPDAQHPRVTENDGHNVEGDSPSLYHLWHLGTTYCTKAMLRGKGHETGDQS